MTSAPHRTDAPAPDDEHPELVMPDSNGAAVYSDLRCPWAHVAVHRLLDAVERAGLEGEIAVDHRAIPLEELGDTDVDALLRTARVLAEVAPDAGWAERPHDASTFPSSSLRALAHVQASKVASPVACVELDRSLRRLLWAEARDIDDPAVLAEAADAVGLDHQRLVDELDSGRPGAEVSAHLETMTSGLIAASPTIVLPDGTTWTNPGFEFHDGDDGPVIDHDDPTIYDEIVDRLLAQRTYD